MQNSQNVSPKGLTDNKYNIRIKWITYKVKQLFKLKNSNTHPPCCCYQESYIGETVRNAELRCQEHELIQKDSESVGHLKNNSTRSFIWKVFLPASSNKRIKQNMEASIIALK